MSSTNRSGTKRKKFDTYITPEPVVERFLDCWEEDLKQDRPDDYQFLYFPECRWLDPAAGGGADWGMTYHDVIKRRYRPNVIDTVDIRPDSLAQIKQDYLTVDLPSYDVIITNPPFSLAIQFIEKSLSLAEPDGYVIMLLRLNFFESKRRFEFFNTYTPERCYVHHRRISFTRDKKTDSIPYMHAVWRKGFYPDYTKLKVI